MKEKRWLCSLSLRERVKNKTPYAEVYIRAMDALF
jgi:hypothetical protein